VQNTQRSQYEEWRNQCAIDALEDNTSFFNGEIRHTAEPLTTRRLFLQGHTGCRLSSRRVVFRRRETKSSNRGVEASASCNLEPQIWPVGKSFILKFSAQKQNAACT